MILLCVCVCVCVLLLFFFALKQRSRVHISEQAGLCRTCRSPEERFLAVEADNVTT